MKGDTRKYRITGLTELLGSLPASQSLHTQYVASKAPDAKLEEEEADFVSADEQGKTVFPRKPGSNDIVFVDYQIKGFIKEAINNLKAENGVAAGRKRVDNFVFVGPRYIPILRDGNVITDEDECYERPLRGQTPMGERISLACSELIYDPWSIEIDITLLPNVGTKLSKSITWDAIEEALDYGFYKGLGQFRNGGFGRFEWERLGA